MLDPQCGLLTHTQVASSPTSFPALRSQVLDLLSAPLGGDRLAAEYLLLSLLSRVTARWVVAT